MSKAAIPFLFLVVLSGSFVAAADDASARGEDLFRRDNLIAWCIVPFDAKKRGPEERAAMLARLGFKHFAYDYRAEHVPTFEAEIEACKRHGVSLDAWWFPGSLSDEARHILALCKKHDIHPQLWISGGGEPTTSADEQKLRVEREAARIRPIAEAAASQNIKVGLYNHGGWFGEPENQLAIIEALKLPNVGIVYNLHHGHDHVDRLDEILKKTRPHLLAVNLNGMNRAGDRQGQKILQLGQGELDLALVRTIRNSGYRGPIGILGHTQDDAEARLQDNLDGLNWLLPQLDGKPPGEKPKPRTPVPGAKPASRPVAQARVSSTGYLAAGRVEYRTPPIAVELRAALKSKSGYNILVACDTKSSPAHWELFSMAGSGLFTAYLPGMNPDHVRTTVDICDGKPHDLAMTYESQRVRLYVDGKLAAEQDVAPKQSGAKLPALEGLAIGQLVEGTIGSDGVVEFVKLKRDDQVLGLWRFNKPDAGEVPDESKFKNPAKRATTTTDRGKAPIPSDGAHLKSADPQVKVELISRSENDVYMGVKVDVDGNVFVGGREAVFVFEPRADGSYAPRRELLRFPPDSIIMGLEFRGDDLFVLTANALYVVPGGRVRHEGLQPQRLLWGLPLDLHVSFHCLAWGPEGDLYITHGDPLLQYGDWTRPDHWGHWTLFSRPIKPRPPVASDDWLKTPYTGQGAVLRYDPDDGSIDVVATGLRGPVGLAFDRAGNLFTNDNDHESRADQYAPAKLLHVVEGIDFGWPRGWMASKSPDRFDLIEPVCDLGRGVPCDLVYYDQPHLPDAFRNRLLMCRWDRHAVTAYKPVPRGASFSSVEETVLTGDDNCRPVGIAVGPDGRLFVTCLYMTGNMAAPYCASDLVVVVGAKTQALSRAKRETPAARQFDWSDAASDDPYVRQLAARRLSRLASLPQLRAMSSDADERVRLTAVLAIGRKLTVPETSFRLPDDLPLFYPQESSFFKRNQLFYGSTEPTDLATHGRIGSFTAAERWRAVPHSADQKELFAMLVNLLDDKSDRIQLQSAFHLSLLKDSRSEPLVEKTHRDVLLERLRTARVWTPNDVWVIGPFNDGDDKTFAKAHVTETANVDLSKKHGGLAWQKIELKRLSDDVEQPKHRRTSTYLYFRIDSGTRQRALMIVNNGGLATLGINGQPATEKVSSQVWIVDLQPGGNDVLVRYQRAIGELRDPFQPLIYASAREKIAFSLPDALDSATLAARLREAAAGGTSQPVPAEFFSVDWAKAGVEGNSVEGRRLFGTLGCSKCHAVAADQKVAGAPSLFEAKRRFTVPHLVESVLLPSRQVAEPFRAESLVLDDGRTLLGLVVSENADTVELLLPDAARRTIGKPAIEERTRTPLSPMPQGLVKTPDELRHLLAYLLGDRPLPP